MGIAGGILFAAGVLSCFLIPIGNVVATSFVIAYVVLFAAVLLKFIKPKSGTASIAQTVLMVLTALLGMIEVVVYYFEDRTYSDVTSASLVGLALMICIFLWMSWNVVIRQYAVDEPIEKKQWVMAGLYVVAMILMASRRGDGNAALSVLRERGKDYDAGWFCFMAWSVWDNIGCYSDLCVVFQWQNGEYRKYREKQYKDKSCTEI